MEGRGHTGGSGSTGPPGGELAGQVALATGGSSGPGPGIARTLARAGARTVVASRRLAECRSAAARVTAGSGRPALGLACDVTDEQAVGGPVGETVARYGRLDVPVTSADVQARGGIAELDPAAFR